MTGGQSLAVLRERLGDAESPPAARGREARSDRSLIAGALAGREADLEQLFKRHWIRAYRAAFLIAQDHAAAEDIAQEAFLAAVRALERFDRRRPFGPWLGAIVANRAIDHARAKHARRELVRDSADLEATLVAGTPDRSNLAGTGRSSELLAALAELTPEQRAVVVMRYVLEYTPGEIARALSLPRGTVNSRLRRGLDAMHASLNTKNQR